LNLGSLGSKNPDRLARPGFLVFIVAVAAAAHELKVFAPIDQAEVGKIVDGLSAWTRVCQVDHAKSIGVASAYALRLPLLLR
jgi:hypothetical protein